MFFFFFHDHKKNKSIQMFYDELVSQCHDDKHLSTTLSSWCFIHLNACSVNLNIF